jgi:hypothetical protein
MMYSTVIDGIDNTPVAEPNVQAVAAAFVAEHLGNAYTVVNGTYYYSKPHARPLWRFLVRCPEGPIGVIHVEPDAGQVLPWTADETRILLEKAELLRARAQAVIPRNKDGYVLREYARRQATAYLSMQIGLQAVATDPIFIPLTPPIWQCLIELQIPRIGAIGVFGLLDVDAYTGEVLPLTGEQIQQIWTRGNAATEFCTPPTTRGK